MSKKTTTKVKVKARTKSKLKSKSNLPPIILLHGFRGNHLGLQDIASYLKRSGFSVYVPDIPPALPEFKEPIGKLGKAFFTTENYSAWVANYIKQNNLKNPVLIGHSMGSIIAAATVAQYPKLTHKKTIFLAPISDKPAKPIASLAPLSALLPNKIVGFITTEYLIVDKTDQRSILDLTYKCSSHNTSRKDIATAAKFSSSYALTDFNLKHKDCLFISGETDRLVKRKSTEQLAENLNAKTVFIPNSGHLINYECPERVSTEIANFIKDSKTNKE